MSQPFRPSTEGTAPSIHPTLLPTFGASRPPMMYAAPQMAYQFAPSQQFVAAPLVYSSQLPTSQSGISSAAAPALQGMYPGMPCTQQFEMHRLPLVRPPGGQRLPSADPTKLIEEQKKLEKERNFQLQQQRLKQFTVAGKKGSLNAENLIDSMFGKPPAKKETPKADKTESQSQGTKFPFEVTSSHPVASISSSLPDPAYSSDLKSIKSTGTEHSGKLLKEQKGLDSMILECSDLSGPQKARTFHKPSVKELPPTSQQGVTFAPSDKARDWSNIHGLDRIFAVPKARFPAWCNKDSVPPLYRQIDALVTGEGSHPPDTNLLYPILMSSGLQRELLGHIWELVNQTSPGHLTQEEMYAALALVAVAQSGHPIKSVDILHSLPKCPLPVLQISTQPKAPIAEDSAEKSAQSAPNSVEADVSTLSPATSVRSQSSGSSITPPTRPSNITISGSNESAAALIPGGNSDLESKVYSWTPFKTPDATSPRSLDDDFDDFKSATPTAVGAHSIIAHSSSGAFSSVTTDDDDEFGDFKQAVCVTAPPSASDVGQKEVPPSASSALLDKQQNMVEQDLMSPEEDKYSVFRLLQEKEKSDWSILGSTATDTQHSVDSDSSILFDISSGPSVLEHKDDLPTHVPSSTDTTLDQMNSNHVEKPKSGSQAVGTLSLPESVQNDDDFGDFLHADVTSSNVPKISLQTTETFKCDFENFADFSNFTEAPSSSPSWVSNTFPAVAVPLSPDDEFGEFTSCHSVHSKPDVGQEFTFQHLRDNISLAESQSVSSLELGAIDGGGHSGESKSSLSRQGSIPSLDLKGACLEGTDNEEGFGEMQNAVVPISSKTPSPSSETTKPAEEKNPPSVLPGFPFQSSTLPLADKYSVIRSEHAKEEDSHISDWTRCLQSCQSILQDATKIFNQMSCSSVCNEVLNSEEGANYVKDVLEVYKVACRISLASKAAGKQTDKLRLIIGEVDQAWNTLAVFLTGSSLMPEESSLDFCYGILRADPENNYKACGLCLINVDARSKAFNKTEESHKLSYGGRQYHSTCANLWVNFVDPLLPALTLPQLL